MNYEIKKLNASDLELAKQLIYQWDTEDGILYPDMPGNHYLLKLLSKETFHVFVAMENNTVVGGLTAYELPMFKVQEHEMFLYEIGVNINYRQKGIASKLIEELKKICLHRNIRTIFVGTSADNEAAKQLYKSTGGEREMIPWFTYTLPENSKHNQMLHE